MSDLRDSPVLLTQWADIQPLLPTIVSLADTHRSELGFLPRAAFAEIASRGRLWILANPTDRQVFAFLAFGGHRHTLRIAQLLVHPTFRGRGYAQILVAHLKKFAADRQFQVIVARVAADLMANGFWAQQGFRVVRQEDGGKTRGRTINVRVHELSTSGLLGSVVSEDSSEWLLPPLSHPLLSTPLYVVDLNIVFDAIREREGTEYARRAFSAAFSGEIRLCVSSELADELKRTSRQSDEDRLLGFALSLPTLPSLKEGKLQTITQKLRQLIFPSRSATRKDAANDVSDLRHLASCIHHGVRGFITREHAILAAAEGLRRDYKLEVLSPCDLVGEDFRNHHISALLALGSQSDSLSVRPYEHGDAGAVRSLISRLEVDTPTGERLLDAAADFKTATRIVLISGSRVIGFALWSSASAISSSHFCYFLLDESASEAQEAIDYVLGSCLVGPPSSDFCRSDLWSSLSQLSTRSTARILGYGSTEDTSTALARQRKLLFRGIVPESRWPRFCTSFANACGASIPGHFPGYPEAIATGIVLARPTDSYKKTIDLFTFETRVGPCIVIAKGRPAVIVPIREKLAAELLPLANSVSPLFAKGAACRIERAYFGRPSLVALVPRGTVVIFYVSGRQGGRAEAVGAGRVTSSGVSAPEDLKHSLLRQGVLSLTDIAMSQGVGTRVGYFTFDSYSPFPHPLSIGVLRKLGCVGPANLITSQELGYDKLVALVEAAFDSR